ncbi:acyl-CoA dehydrogenase family protein [Microbacterium rhizomatis]|uniref:Acyl-CoA dehydrogenase n=1 Tax=Microbacterium rhizomatis TaxID=1631477 RepID=A0A5J5J1H1_9MICO|nr:acyl-CoA dehydrogenase family protein [Microbacterium rhizomatis]KAA9108207.1 acyl-CoA dehydrogenase [Microbacterium rhizomatis]
MFPPISPDLSPVFGRFMDQRCAWDADREPAAGAPTLWRALAEEVGAAGLLVDDDLGGQGGTLVELAAAIAEAARCGWSGPLVATAGVAVTLLRRVDPSDRCGLLREIAEDAVIVVVALHEDERGASLDATARLTHAGDIARIDGRKTFVDSGMHADVILVPAVDDEGVAHIARVDCATAGVTRTPMDAVDPGRGLATIEFEHAEAVIVSSGAETVAAVRDAWLTGALLTGVDLLASAIRAYSLALEYAVVREQFGRPIASFQSIKHKLVDMYGELQTAYSAVIAAVSTDPADPEWDFAASAAKVRSGDAAMQVLREAVQVHGGIGFTWEHEVSHHFRRVVAERALYGTPTHHRTLVAAASGF